MCAVSLVSETSHNVTWTQQQRNENVVYKLGERNWRGRRLFVFSNISRFTVSINTSND